jgi:phospholipid:diacylglycerol acyltransferase
MWIKGGNAVWGNGVHAPDDECNAIHSHGQLIAFRQSQAGIVARGETWRNMTADEASRWILEHTPSTFQVGVSMCLVLHGLMLVVEIENDCYELFVWD